MSYHIRSGFVFLFLFFPKQLQNVSRAESSSDEVLTDAEPDLEEQPPTDDLELEEYASEMSEGEDENYKDPEWSLLEETAENQDSGDDEEKDTPESKNTLR